MLVFERKLLIAAALCLSSHLLMSQEKSQACSTGADTVIAARVARAISLDARHPAPEWETATPVLFCADWQGKNTDPERQTRVRVLWTPKTLYLRFECRYRELFVFDDSDPNGRRDHLWDRDVAEVFLQPDPSRPLYYREFEVSPNGMWIDLDIFPEGRSDLKSGLARSVWLDKEQPHLGGRVGNPHEGVDSDHSIRPRCGGRISIAWRVRGSHGFYSAWQATKTPQPNFHVPAAFGKMRFGEK